MLCHCYSQLLKSLSDGTLCLNKCILIYCQDVSRTSILQHAVGSFAHITVLDALYLHTCSSEP